MEKENIIKYANGLNANENIINWIDKNIKDNKEINVSEVEHIIDYLVSDKAPERIEKATYIQMKNNTNKWNKTLQKKGNNINETEKDIKIILDFKNGFKIVKLIGENAYKREGFLMRNCVASYFGKDVEVYSLRDKNNMPHCTIEKDKQIKGKGNGIIHPNYINYVIKFLEWSGMKVRDNEMSNLGYNVPLFYNFVKTKLYKNKYNYNKNKIEYKKGYKIIENI